MILPDIYFAFEWRRGERPLFFHRDAAGTIRLAPAAELEPAHGSLLVYGPGTPFWDEDGLGVLSRIRDGGGAVLPLGGVLSRCGFPERIRREELLERLGGIRVDLEDPRREGREILERLAEILEGLEEEPAEDAESPARPRALVVSDVMTAPEAPGVYTFYSTEGRAIYVGKARSLRRRLGSHFRTRGGEPAKRAALIADAVEVRWEETGSELEALLLEHLALGRHQPAINIQRTAHRRPRGEWRERAVALLLPSAHAESVEICLVSGDGRFHWERIDPKKKLPRGSWSRCVAFLEGRSGWAPGERVALPVTLAEELAEVVLSWLVRNGGTVTQIDLTHETAAPDLQGRMARWITQDPRGGRVEVK